MTSYRTKREAEVVANQATQENKRVKTVMNSIADEYVCPITQELPLEPVTAEDGKIYERSAIEEWLGQNKRSPSTNKVMGAKLLPATQVRNVIEQLVKSGAIGGEKVARWKEKLKHEEKLKNLRAQAEAGDAESIYLLAHAYKNAKYGLTKDKSEALRWFTRGAELGEVRCLATAGEYLSKGIGCERKCIDGLILLARAAEHSNVAAWQLAKAYLAGYFGLSKNEAHAKYWLKKVVDGSCTHNTLSLENVAIASEMLQKLERQGASH